MRILVDMDGVIADFDGEFLRRWRKRHPDSWYVPFEGRTTFYVRDQYPGELRPLVDEILWEPGFFRDMLPVEGARDALFDMADLGWEVFLCSSPLTNYRNSTLEKYEWVEKVLGPDWIKRVILTKDKTLVKAEYLIDDKPEITGVEKVPAWEHLLFDRPYNRGANRRRITWGTWRGVLGGAHDFTRV